MRLLVLLSAFLSLLSAACCFGDDNRNHRLAIRDSESGEWSFISPPGRSVSLAEWLPGSTALLVIEGEPQEAAGPAQPGGYFITVRELDGDVRWEVEGDMSDRQPLAAAGSPDGSEVAILRDTMGQGERSAFIEVRDAADGSVLRSSEEWVTQLTDGFTPYAAGVAWTSDGRLAVVSHHGGGSSNDLRWFDAASLEAQPGEPTEVSEVSVAASPVGSEVVVLGVRHPGGTHSLVLHGADGASRELPVGTGGNIAFDFAPGGEHLVLAHAERITIFDLETGDSHDIRDAQTQGICWGANGRIAIAWGSRLMSFAEDGSDLDTLVDLSGGRTARSPACSPDGRYLAFVVEPKYRD
ncbi:MAG: hypothetical protein IT303_01135 [Dehalococcoidia bacterium]|nr:hypothetical protein [Dehalococcoidia bacterium]